MLRVPLDAIKSPCKHGQVALIQAVKILKSPMRHVKVQPSCKAEIPPDVTFPRTQQQIDTDEQRSLHHMQCLGARRMIAVGCDISSGSMEVRG